MTELDPVDDVAVVVDDTLVDDSDDDAVNALGDQDADNTAPSYQPPADAYIPTAQNVRRYPELFNEDVIASFNVPNPNDVEEVEGDVELDGELDVTTADEPQSRVTFP